MLRTHLCVSLPNDVLSYSGKDFFDLICRTCGETIQELMEKLSISSVKTLLGVEGDIFSVFQENCQELQDIKQRACLFLDDGTIKLKPGLRIEFDRLMDALLALNSQNQPSRSTSDSATDSTSLIRAFSKFYELEDDNSSNNHFFLKTFVDNIVSNLTKSKNNYRYNELVMKFAQSLYISGKRNAYEFVRLNISGGLPTRSTIETSLVKAGAKIIEGKFRFDALRDHQNFVNYELAVCSEDCTAAIRRVMFDASTNTFIGFSTPLKSGVPVPEYFQTDSFEQLKQWFENEDKSTNLNVHMLQPLTAIGSTSSHFMLAAFGTNNKFDATDVLQRRLFIFEQSLLSNVRILVFSTDCDPKYLCAMRLVTGFFARLPNIPLSEHDDALEVKLPKGWSSWFFMRTRQLFFCVQDPVHLCTKIRNRLLSDTASMLIGEGRVSIDILIDLIDNQSKLVHGLVKTDVQPKDRQNFASCLKISSDDVLSALESVPGSYATRIYLHLLRSIVLAYVEKSTLIVDRIYHAWMAVFITRLWWTWLNLMDAKKLFTDDDQTNKDYLFITQPAYYSIELNAHSLLSIALLVCQNDLPEEALSVSSFNSQTCENIFRLTGSISGAFSSVVNFSIQQFLKRASKLTVLHEIERQSENDPSGCSLKFPKHHKRLRRTSALITRASQAATVPLTHDIIENTICRAFDDAYSMLSKLGISKILNKAHIRTLNQVSVFVRTQLEQKPQTVDYISSQNDSSNDDSDTNVECDVDTSTSSGNSSDDEHVSNSSRGSRSQFRKMRIFDTISPSLVKSYFPIKIDGSKKYIHKQTACWLLADDKAGLSADRLQRVQQASR